MASANYFSLWDVDQLKAAIFNAYAQTGAGTQACLELNQSLQGMTATEIYSMCESLDNMGMITNSLNEVYPTAISGSMGSALKVESSFVNTAEAAGIEAAQALNSNTTAAAARTATVNVPVDYVAGQSGVTVSAGAKAVGGATKATTLMNAAQAVVAAGIGVQLGVWIDGALYNANPDFWDSHNLSEINPETWAGTTIGEGLLKWAHYPYSPVLMDDDGQVYANQDLVALVAQYLAMEGAFDYLTDLDTSDVPADILNFHDYPEMCPFTTGVATRLSGGNTWTYYPKNPQAPVYTAFPSPNYIIQISEQPFEGVDFYLNGNYFMTGSYRGERVARSGRSYYVACNGTYDQHMPDNLIPATWGVDWNGNNEDARIYDCVNLFDTGTIIYSGMEGVHKFDVTPEGILPDMSISDILDLLEDQYPDLFDQKLKLGSLQPDGTIQDDYYLPIGWPEGGTDTQPTSKPENKDAIDPQNEGQAKRATEANKPADTTGNGDDKGSGQGPAYVAPTGTAEALYAIYNPTVQQVKDLGAWLWSSAFIDQLLKMFSNPMEAIISLHKIYGTPTTAAQPQNIKVGYLDSGVSSKIVTDQYITIDCGQVALNEVFGSVLDYAPYVEVSLYLPFIGIVQLDVADVMRGKVKVIYHIDVITGAVLAEVKVTRDGTAGGVIYQYTGSCAEHYPLSSGTYMGIVTGAAGITAGVVGTVMSGGALAPMLLGGAASIGAMHTNVQKSGSFSSNAGAMGIKKPYFIISRPQSAMAEQFQHYTGYGANTYCTLASVKGYVRVKHIHLDNIQGATAEDLDYIDTILKRGVLNG